MLLLTIDQCRGDLPLRYRDRFCEGGFNYLLNRGTLFRDAHQQHANTETIVGHTTLSTGADPAVRGMIGNVWLDRTTDELKYTKIIELDLPGDKCHQTSDLRNRSVS